MKNKNNKRTVDIFKQGQEYILKLTVPDGRTAQRELGDNLVLAVLDATEVLKKVKAVQSDFSVVLACYLTQSERDAFSALKSI